MFNPSIYNCSAKILYDGVPYPNAGSSSKGYAINLAHPYAGMGVDLELKKVTGWENKTIMINSDFSKRLEPIPAPEFTADEEDIVLTYAYYTPEIVTPSKPQSETSDKWNARSVFAFGGEVVITEQNGDSSYTRSGLIVSRTIYHNEKVPMLEVVIKPYHPGWKRTVERRAGSWNGVTPDIISPTIGPVPFTFDATSAASTSNGTLQIDLFVKRKGSYINVPYTPPDLPKPEPEPITDRITFYGPTILAGRTIKFHIDTAFPFNATIETNNDVVSLAPYLYNESNGRVLSSPRLFMPGGKTPLNIWCEMRVNNTAIEVNSQWVRNDEYV